MEPCHLLPRVAADAEAEGAVQDAKFRLRRLARTVSGGEAAAIMIDLLLRQAEDLHHAIDAVVHWQDGAATGVRMLHEEPANQIMVVADAIRAVLATGEQQTRRLDPARCDDVVVGDDSHRSTGERFEHHRFYCAAVALAD